MRCAKGKNEAHAVIDTTATDAAGGRDGSESDGDDGVDGDEGMWDMDAIGTLLGCILWPSPLHAARVEASTDAIGSGGPFGRSDMVAQPRPPLLCSKAATAAAARVRTACGGRTVTRMSVVRVGVSSVEGDAGGDNGNDAEGGAIGGGDGRTVWWDALGWECAEVKGLSADTAAIAAATAVSMFRGGGGAVEGVRNTRLTPNPGADAVIAGAAAAAAVGELGEGTVCDSGTCVMCGPELPAAVAGSGTRRSLRPNGSDRTVGLGEPSTECEPKKCEGTTKHGRWSTRVRTASARSTVVA